MLKQIKESTNYILGKCGKEPEIGIILGSGLGDLANEVTDFLMIPFEEIPFFPRSTVEGHSGKLFIGDLMGKRVFVMQGRVHFYEGYKMQQVTYPIRIMQEIGIKTLIITNAAGGLCSDYQKAGDLMLITDHIFLGENPLIGKNYEELGVRFPDMSEAYNKKLQEVARNAAKRLSIDLKEGIYIPITGPSYSTKAELRMLKILGGNAVGMSTAPEVIAAVHGGIKALGITCITDIADPDNMETPPSHEEIVKVANETKPKFISLIKEILQDL